MELDLVSPIIWLELRKFPGDMAWTRGCCSLRRVSSNTWVAAMQRGEKALAASGDAETVATCGIIGLDLVGRHAERRDGSGGQW